MHSLSQADLSIWPMSGGSEVQARSEIMLKGTRTGAILDGAVLEAALSWHEYIIVFLTDDVPYEDTLRIYLLDANLCIVDSASLGAMYSTGAFRDLQVVQSDTVRFRFIGDVTWTLRLFDKRTLALPVLFDPVGVRRPFRFYRHFALTPSSGTRKEAAKL
ncbi:hypothetical protein GCM10027277_55350 [Pseudoduganella ginsengisoli]|uniref:Uncharacterized protein n=1 Tax=Pseudoduganella ginsengisoli TaxID=1462440 RepID=A0A6L6Q6S4_9BURK|nr:hypothetical protein [Pseudoduganella ginsengisoli]MTW04971.1 hypothetical protein [Pseudoduganella ginsengisoli]